MTVQPSVYEACMREAATRGEGLMRHMIEGARPVLYQCAQAAMDTSERAKQQEILRRLNASEDFLARRFPELLLSEFQGAPRDEPSKTEAISFDQLELMDDDQIEERVEIARILQRITDRTEASLSELNRLICGAQGLNRVVAGRNPLRPEAYARALRAVLSQTGEARVVRLAWLHGMGDSLGEGLAQTYDELSGILREAGVEPASYQVTQHVPEAGSSATKQGGVEDSLLTLDHLHRLLSGDLDEEEASAGDRKSRRGQAFSPTVPAAFETLVEMNQVDTVLRRVSERFQEIGGTHGTRPETPPRPEDGIPPHDALRHRALSVGQSLGLEVVTLMVDNMVGDARLPAPVRETVRMLEPALLRLALRDPRFFSDRRHPARRLLDEMTRRGLGFRSEAEEGFDAFIEPLRSAVSALATVVVEGPEPFDLALQALREEWRQQSREELSRRERARKALESAEQRHLLAEKIADNLRARADMADAHPAVVGMLTGPWAQFMAQARLDGLANGRNPEAEEELIRDLLWSANPVMARSNRSRLLRLVPGMIERLRQGLDRIECPAARQDAFFEALMSLHQQALKPPEGAGERLIGGKDRGFGEGQQPTVSAVREAMEARFSQADADTDVWLVRREAQDSGFFDSEPVPGPGPAPEDPAVSEDETSAFHLMVQPGAWIELWVQEKWVRAQLSWASPQGKLFMYTGSGGAAHSLSQRSLRHLLAEGRIRLLASQAPVDGALDAVAQVALRNSVAVK